MRAAALCGIDDRADQFLSARRPFVLEDAFNGLDPFTGFMRIGLRYGAGAILRGEVVRGGRRHGRGLPGEPSISLLMARSNSGSGTLRFFADEVICMPTAIVTDSACDLGPGQARSIGIDLVPIVVRFGDRAYRDGVDLTLRDFYAKLDPSGELPVTEPPPEEAFVEAFQKHVSAGREVVCPTVSSKVSKLYEIACAAAAKFAGRVHVIDAKTISGGIGLLASGAAKLARTGADAPTIAATLRKWIDSQRGYAIYPDLKFLAKSGRINKAQLVLGTVMQMKPITRVNPDGTLESETTVKSFEQAKEMIASIASRRLANPACARIAVMHTNAPELGAFLAETLRSKLAATPAEMNVWEAGPAIAANAGPGAAAIFMVEN